MIDITRQFLLSELRLAGANDETLQLAEKTNNESIISAILLQRSINLIVSKELEK